MIIRFPNPKSDLNEIVKLTNYILSFLEDNSRDSFTIRDIADYITQKGEISSQKSVGSKAIQSSYREDLSRDSVYNQTKSLLEVFRNLGIVYPDGNRHTFRVTKFAHILRLLQENIPDDSKNLIKDLLMHSFLNVNFKHPLNSIKGDKFLNIKPFWLFLILLEEIYFLTKDEFITFVLGTKCDSNICKEKLLNRIYMSRNQNGCFLKTKNKIFTYMENNELKSIQENTARNYTRIPLSFLKDFNLIKKIKIKDLDSELLSKIQYIEGKHIDSINRNKEVFILTEFGKKFLKRYKNWENIKYKDIYGNENNQIIYAIKGLTDFFLVKGFQIDIEQIFSILVSENLIQNEDTNKIKEFLKKDKIFTFPYQILDVKIVPKYEDIIESIKDIKHIIDNLHIDRINFDQISDVENIESIEGYLNKAPSIKYKDSHSIEYSCLNCRPSLCIEYKEEELNFEIETLNEIPDKNPKKVCPTDAIFINEENYPSIDHSKCIFCMLCLSRCPYYSIFFDDNEKKLKIDMSLNSNLELKSGSLEECKNYFSELEKQVKLIKRKYVIDKEVFLEISKLFLEKVSSLKKEEFYPLVRNLFRELYFKTKQGREGDTQWRYDAIILEPFIIPLEIKSPTENERINPNAVRQAIENLITIEARYALAKNPISGVVGFKYPNKRSDVEYLYKDAKESFNMRIFIISIVVLFYLNLKKLEDKFIPPDIFYLIENTVGLIDDYAIKEFWINYLKRRDELKAIGELSEYFKFKKEIPEEHFDLNFYSKLKEEVEFFLDIYEIIKALK